MAEFEFDNIDASTYNNASAVKMDIDSHSLFVCGQKVQAHGKDIDATFGRISKRWDELKLGWTGRSSDEAETFRANYMLAVEDFFGQPGEAKDRKIGVLNQFAGGIKGAGNGYAQVESSLKVAFEMFADALLDIGAPQGDRDNYVPPHATWTLPEETKTELKEGHRDSDAPPVAENVDKDAKPWFTEGQTVKGEWTWTESRDTNNNGNFDDDLDLQITVKDGATWTGQPNDKVTVEWVNDSDGKPAKK